MGVESNLTIEKTVYQIKRPELHEKVFVIRESLLTELFRISHIQALRNMIFAALILTLLNVVMYDVATFGM